MIYKNHHINTKHTEDGVIAVLDGEELSGYHGCVESAIAEAKRQVDDPMPLLSELPSPPPAWRMDTRRVTHEN